MPEANFDVGDTFRVQFVWRIPDGDRIRAIFQVEALHRDFLSEKYVIRLVEFLAGRQETDEGVMRERSEVAREYWAMVDQLQGRRISLAFEADDGRPLWLRLETLTGEHNFFRRLDELPPNLQNKRQKPQE